ncbi:MAG: siderophore-interacting protein [Silanimonas sp.]|nr:MAG: siderophore-interacting protein [Silanimonas sp.]
MTDITLLLGAAGRGDQDALQRAYAAVYGELKKIAAGLLRGRDDTLSPTVLVNEAYLRLCGGQGVTPESRKHFYATAAQAMRWIITDLARQRGAERRGGDWQRVELDERLPAAAADTDWIAVDAALTHLGRIDPAKRELVELRFFAGLDYPELAELLGRSERSLKRDWAAARALLMALLDEAAE